METTEFNKMRNEYLLWILKDTWDGLRWSLLIAAVLFLFLLGIDMFIPSV